MLLSPSTANEQLDRVGHVETTVLTPSIPVRSSVDRARWQDPRTALTGDGRDQVKVRVVVKHRDVEFLGGRCNEQVGDLPSPLAALGQEALNLECSVDVGGCGLNRVESSEGPDKAVPLFGGSGGVADFEIADTRPTKLAGSSQGFHDFTDLSTAEPLQHTGVDEKPQRHAWSRSPRSAWARMSSAAATLRPRSCVARWSASLTVSLIVAVPSSARAAFSASSSRSIRCLATGDQYIRQAHGI
jgi:hypothetical protein